jgi:hypothetical protein
MTRGPQENLLGGFCREEMVYFSLSCSKEAEITHKNRPLMFVCLYKYNNSSEKDFLRFIVKVTHGFFCEQG